MAPLAAAVGTHAADHAAQFSRLALGRVLVVTSATACLLKPTLHVAETGAETDRPLLLGGGAHSVRVPWATSLVPGTARVVRRLRVRRRRPALEPGGGSGN